MARGCSLATHWMDVSSLTSPRPLRHPSTTRVSHPPHPLLPGTHCSCLCPGRGKIQKIRVGDSMSCLFCHRDADWESWHHRSDSTAFLIALCRCRACSPGNNDGFPLEEGPLAARHGPIGVGAWSMPTTTSFSRSGTRHLGSTRERVDENGNRYTYIPKAERDSYLAN